MKPAILGISGTHLLEEEAALFRRYAPAGVILFGRNIMSRPQLAALVGALRDVLPAEAVIMVDQEGGRVARLRPPDWAAHPSAGMIGALYARDPEAGLRAAWLHGAAIGAECRVSGFDMVAAPVLDLRLAGQSDVVGDRSFGSDPATVAQLAGAMAEGVAAAGVIAVGKHAPGHGRAHVDSHHELPRAAADTAALAADIAPFAALAPRLPCLMTAHMLYEGIDDDRPATLSPTVIGSLIRERIGFAGLLISDDLAMKALRGLPADLACASLAAGCDIALYCPGDSESNVRLLEAVGDDRELPDRLAAARPAATALDLEMLVADRQRLLDRS